MRRTAISAPRRHLHQSVLLRTPRAERAPGRARGIQAEHAIRAVVPAARPVPVHDEVVSTVQLVPWERARRTPFGGAVPIDALSRGRAAARERREREIRVAPPCRLDDRRLEAALDLG